MLTFKCHRHILLFTLISTTDHHLYQEKLHIINVFIRQNEISLTSNSKKVELIHSSLFLCWLLANNCIDALVIQCIDKHEYDQKTQ